SDRAVWHSHAGQINLVHVHNPVNRAILSNNFAQKPAFEVQNFGAPHFGVEEYFFGNVWFNHFSHLVPVFSGLARTTSESASTSQCANLLPIATRFPF